jgi:curli biogenesis system outer membrane secretion channel CsgG
MLNNKLKVSLLSVVVIAVFTGCGGNKIDVLSYPEKIKTKVTIPEVCIPEYKSAMPFVAVMDFTNNSTFGKGQIDETKSNSNLFRKSAGVAGIVASPVGIGMGAATASNVKRKSKTTNLKRSVDAKLSKSITGPLETLVVNSGGAKLFTRTDMYKIDAELKFQDSGLVDPDTVVEFGKTSGVRYIITGSIDNVEQKYTDNSRATNGLSDVTKQSGNQSIKLVGALLSLGTSLTDGMDITAKMTIKMIDVQTGKIIFSKQLEETSHIGKIPYPTYDQIIGGIKAAMLESLPRLKEDLVNHFTVKGYITQIKSKDDDIIVQVNIGRDFKVEENQIFKVYSFDEIEDPMSGSISCDIIETMVKLRASQQIMKNNTWTNIEEGDGKTLKLGQLVQKSHQKAGFAIPTF